MRRLSTFFVCTLLIIATTTLTIAFASGDSEPAVDVIFIMDLSGSMNNADPERVSLTSVAMFADLLSESSSQIGYVTFSTDVIESMPLTSIEQARSRIRNNLLTSEFSGWTNIPAALDEALNLFNQSSSQNQKIAILFTDGNVELPSGSGISNRQGEDKSFEIAQAFNDARIPLYTVGLNFDGSLNMDFSQRLSELSSSPGLTARTYEAKTNWDLPEIFSKIYISIFNGNANIGLYFDAENESRTAVFWADEGIYEINIILIHDKQLEHLTIHSPNGQQYAGTSFITRDGYSIAKIRYPDVGDWEFSFQGDYISANKLVRYITDTSRTVRVSFNTDGGADIEPIELLIGRTLHNIPKPSKEGFSFEGWYLNEARTQRLYNEQTFSRDTLLYANWIPLQVYNIVLTSDGETIQTLRLHEGERFYNHITDPPIRRSHKFLGWHHINGTELNMNSIIEENTTLIAHWEKIEANLIPSIILLILSIIVFTGGMIAGNVLFRNPSFISERFCSALSATFTLVFSFTCWSFLQLYILPIEIMSIEPIRDTVGSYTFESSLHSFSILGGLVAPIILTMLLATILPFLAVSPASKFGKEKQYIIHFIITFIGIIWPIIIWVIFGSGVSMLWVVGYSLITYPVNFFLSALLFKQGSSQKCIRFFFDW